jgi:hypothetical protein
MYQNFIVPYLFEVQHVSGDTSPTIRSLKLHWKPLVFHTWRVVGRVVGGRCQAHPPTTRPTTFHVCKTRGCQCSFRLLVVGGVSPETRWVSHKYKIIKFWYIIASCWIFLYKLYYDARIHEHQPYPRVSLFAPRQLCSQERLFLGIKNSGGHFRPLATKWRLCISVCLIGRIRTTADFPCSEWTCNYIDL